MNNKLKVFIFMIIMLVGIVSAIDWTPPGDINMFGVYQITNGTNITATSIYALGQIYINGTGVSTAAGWITSLKYLYNDSTTIYLNESTLNTTITANIIPNWITSLKYLFNDSTKIYLNESLLNSTISAVATPLFISDHAGLSNLTADDHTLYLLANGSRSLSGNWNNGVYNITANKLFATNWSNVSIIQSQITDLTHTSDTNASSICSGTTTYLDGEGNCDDISGVYVDVSGDTLTGNIDTTQNITVTGFLCFTTDCSAKMYHNGTGMVIES